MELKLIGYDSDSVFYEAKKARKTYFKKGMKCCYCSIDLTKETCTREHIIAKSRGGKLVKPCCITCNREKANMTLHWYIKFLKSNTTTDLNEIKISNAEAILNNLNQSNSTPLKIKSTHS